MRFLESVSDAIVNRSPDELIGALMIAGTIALAVAGLYSLGRRKASPSPTFVGGLSLATGASCMALAAGYLEYRETRWSSDSAANLPANAIWSPGPPGRLAPPPWNFHRAGWSSGFHVVVAADENRDGRLTPEEAARMVREADSDGDGSVNFFEIDRLIASRFQPQSRPTGKSDAEPNDRGNGDGPAVNGAGTWPSSDADPPKNPDE